MTAWKRNLDSFEFRVLYRVTVQYLSSTLHTYPPLLEIVIIAPRSREVVKGNISTSKDAHMHYPAYEVPRTHLPRALVNRGLGPSGVPLLTHSPS